MTFLYLIYKQRSSLIYLRSILHSFKIILKKYTDFIIKNRILSSPLHTTKFSLKKKMTNYILLYTSMTILVKYTIMYIAHTK